MRPDIIPGYAIERRIGKGGMASVYLAVQESLGRPVALKVLSDFDSPEYSRRFLNEGRTIAQLIHANIITIHDIGVVRGLHYLSMEYVDGGDLNQRIRGGVTPAFALDIVAKVARALALAHRRGVVHRDVKPANILFRDDRTPLLTDFGIAKQLGGTQDVSTTGTILGSPYYMSPEQAQGKAVDGRSDIYSLGIILYEMLNGWKPFVAESDISTIVKQMNEPLPRLPAALRDYQDLLDRMTAKDVDARFTNAEELLAFLSVLPANLAPTPSQTPVPSPTSAAPNKSVGEDSTLVIPAADASVPGVPKKRLLLLGGAMLTAAALAATLHIARRLAGPWADATVGYSVEGDRAEMASAVPPEAEDFFNEAMALRNDTSGDADDARALRLLQEAVALGHGWAQYELGRMHGQGRGTPKDYRRAVHWFQKAARRRVAEAQHLLCLAYAAGRGVERDRVLAHAWCQIAAEQGSKEADGTLKSLHPFMTRGKLQTANALAERLRKEINEGGALPAPESPQGVWLHPQPKRPAAAQDQPVVTP
ncbi:MAG: serine/threonine-protein kinase [Gammaproteobacteria bacterium]